MPSSLFSSWRKVLSPQAALDLANAHLENARRAKNSELALTLCDDAETSLARIRSSVRKTIVSSASVEDQAVRKEIASTYFELGELFDNLKRHSKAQTCYKDSKNWGGHIQKPSQPLSLPGSVVSSPAQDHTVDHLVVHPLPTSPPPPPPTPLPLIQETIGRSIAIIPAHIFANDMHQPPDINKLPKPDDRLKSTSQLLHCLSLLQSSQSADDELDPTEQTWLNNTAQNSDEQERLEILATKLLREFAREELKDANAVAEVVCLVPVFEKDQFQQLLQRFFHGIEQSQLLDLNLLEGLAQLVQGARPGHLTADNLVKILDLISTRLRGTHKQSPESIYRLALTVSFVLDAMTDSKIKDLDRETLHAPLAAYLQGLGGSADPHLVYQAAYAAQALLYVPDDETPWQATWRRTGKVVKGVSGLVSAVKAVDLNGFLESLEHIQEGLAGASEIFTLAKDAYDDFSALAESGKQFLDCLKEGFDFRRKRAWYPALRDVDVLLRNGQLKEFKRLICEAPCRHDPAFQWGVCQRLGELAANIDCDNESRESAVAFLGEVYQNDVAWGQHIKIKQLIIDILMQLAGPSGSEMQAAETLLRELETDGDAKKKALYKACRKEGPSPYLLKPVHPLLAPSLLDRVQDRVDVEASLRKLQRRRLQAKNKDIYISPLAKAGLKTRNDVLFSLVEKVKEFLGGEQKVFLILGDSGAGKSTFNQELECDLWNNYKKHDGDIPLFITLAAILDPEHDMIAKQLRTEGFTEPQIQELKDHRKFILICDGYDECRQMQNFYMSNRLNQAGGWRAQMLISCRSEYLGADYQDMFQPLDRNHRVKSPLFQEAVVAPFSKDQIQEYIQQYVTKNSMKWSATNYIQALDRIPGLKDLVTNPFLLSLSLEVLPRMMHSGQPLSATRITRVALYDQFVEQWLERGRIRLFENVGRLDNLDKEAFQNLSNEGFMQEGVGLLKEMAVAIYERQAGNSVIVYSSTKDRGTWKEELFGQGHEKKLLREACPLKRNGNQHRFLHQSLLEYSLARAIFEPEDEGDEEPENEIPTTTEFRQRSDSPGGLFEADGELDDTITTVAQPVLDSPLGRKSYVGEPSILQFLVERVSQEPLFKKQLLSVIERSKTQTTDIETVRLAAANAITILVRAGVQFNGADLRGIQIPGADLSQGAFEFTQFQGADLSEVIFLNVSLRGANLNKAQMSGVQFGESPFLAEQRPVDSCVYSPDGKTFTVLLHNGDINIYTTSDWDRMLTISGHSEYVRSVVYSPKGDQIASGSDDMTVRLWDVETGECLHTLSSHAGSVSSVLYSPKGDQIASVYSDGTLRLWDVETGDCRHSLSGHISDVMSIVYSPKGDQIASGSLDKTVRLWDVETGYCRHTLSGHSDWIRSVVYSPRGDQIASSCQDGTVRLWNVEAGDCRHTLSGHSRSVTSVVYSPKGDQIASGSEDFTVRLWDVETGDCQHILSDYRANTSSIAYSPEGDQIAFGSWDMTVQLWDVETGECRHTLRGHVDWVTNVVYSPKGDQIASGSEDMTVRLWDIDTGDRRRTLNCHSHWVLSVMYSPKDDQIASGSYDMTVRLWDVETGYCHHTLSGLGTNFTSAVYSPKGDQIASGSSDNTVLLWDVETGVCHHTLSGHTDLIRSVVYSPRGDQIASGSYDNTVRLWDVETGDCRHILSGHNRPVTSVVYSPNGEQVASGSEDWTVRLWDVETGDCRHILSCYYDSVLSVVYSPKGDQIASCGRDMTVRLWDVETGDCRHTLIGHSCLVTSVVYSRNDVQIATGSEDGTVRLWDVETGDCRHTLSGHKSDVTNVVYSPKGDQIASGSHDETVRLWDVVSGQCLVVIETYTNFNIIAWKALPYGNCLVTGGGDGSVRLWLIKKGGKELYARLHWRSPPKENILAGVSMEDVEGLSQLNRRLLIQRGAMYEPEPL